jgi:uncharacterized protein (DUF111 family)
LLLGAPITPVDSDDETVTPTGAALLASLTDRWGPLPAGTLTGLSRGAGGRDPKSHPNVLSAYLLDRAATPIGAVGQPLNPQVDPGPEQIGYTMEPRVELTTNIDDIPPELVAYVIEAALANGADDAWSSPITMKKGRSAAALTVLCRWELVGSIQELLLAETGSLGLRVRPTEKRVLARSEETVTVEGHPIRIKTGPFRAKPEFDDVAAAARALGWPFRRVAQTALAQTIGQNDQTGPNSEL